LERDNLGRPFGLTSGLIEELDYARSPSWKTEIPDDLIQAQTHRLALRAGVIGGYYLPTAPKHGAAAARSSFPAVYVAEAGSPAEARSLRRKLWNLGSAPFLILVLPDQIRVYANFLYDSDNEERGLLNEVHECPPYRLSDKLSDYHRVQLDSGRLWSLRPEALRVDQRVDEHLLRNLDALGERLRNTYALTAHTAHALVGKFIYIHYH
jgi:hypothetical protein